jgi:SNF family Na+-dependent transporter
VGLPTPSVREKEPPPSPVIYDLLSLGFIYFYYLFIFTFYFSGLTSTIAMVLYKNGLVQEAIIGQLDMMVDLALSVVVVLLGEVGAVVAEAPAVIADHHTPSDQLPLASLTDLEFVKDILGKNLMTNKSKFLRHSHDSLI